MQKIGSDEACQAVVPEPCKRCVWRDRGSTFCMRVACPKGARHWQVIYKMADGKKRRLFDLHGHVRQFPTRAAALRFAIRFGFDVVAVKEVYQ